MGNPIKITDLAERMLILYKNLEKPIEIKYSALQTGEKLHEDIVSKNEKLIPTDWKDIFIVKKITNTNTAGIDFSKILSIKASTSNLEIKTILTDYVTNF